MSHKPNKIVLPKKPKRSYRCNIWGNVVGYEGGRRTEEFGCQPWSERVAIKWVEGMSRKEAEDQAFD